MQPAGFITDAREVEAKLRNQYRTERKPSDSFQSVLGCHNCCCSRRVATVSPGRPRQPAVTPIYKSMPEQTIRTSRMEQVEQLRSKNRSTLKPQYGSLLSNPWNGGTMRIRYCGFEDIRENRRTDLFNKVRYAVRIVPPFRGLLSPSPSVGFRVERLFDRNRSTCASISGVIE